MIAIVVGNHNVERYVAFENETKYATKTASHNFPIIEQRGDVFEADFTEFEGFDVVLAGFPCTKFSVAQKKERETEPYSGEGWLLFEQAWRAVCEAKPKYFLFENNKSMAKAVQSEISKIVGFEPICINSALVSAQNRNRLYWVGKRNPDGTYSKVHVEQPEDRGILLRDVLDGIGAKELSEREMDYMVHSTNGKYSDRWAYLQKPGQSDKALCITANVSKGVPYNIVAESVCVAERGRYSADGIEQHYEAREDGKTNVLTTVQKDNQVCEPVRVGTYPNNAKNQAHDSQQYRIYSIEAKSVTLCGNGGGMGAKTGLYSFEVPIYAEVTEWDENGKPIKAKSYADGKEYPVYEVKDGQITIKGKTYPIKLKDGFYIIRKLTVRECMRLQTVPEWYEFPVSDSQAYKMLGNGWTVDVIVHILSFIREG
jgi:DNA (cytosine-5)-methyltransferase 3A